MKQGQDVKRGETLVWAKNESEFLAGRGLKATVVKVETVKREGQSLGTKMVLAQVAGEDAPRHLSYKDLSVDWDRYNARHQEARVAARDAHAHAHALLERLVALDVVDAPPTEEQAGKGKGGVDYWVGPVRYKRLPDQTPKGVEMHLDPAAVVRLLAVLPEAP